MLSAYLDGREFGVVARGDALVSEDAPDLVHAIEPPHLQCSHRHEGQSAKGRERLRRQSTEMQHTTPQLQCGHRHAVRGARARERTLSSLIHCHSEAHYMAHGVDPTHGAPSSSTTTVPSHLTPPIHTFVLHHPHPASPPARTTNLFRCSSVAMRSTISCPRALWCVLKGRASAPPASACSTGVSTSMNPLESMNWRMVDRIWWDGMK